MALSVLNMFSIIETLFHTVFLLIQQSWVAMGIAKNIKRVQWTCCNLSVLSHYFSGDIWNQRHSRQGSASSGGATFPALSWVPLLLITCLIDTSAFFLHFIVFFPTSDLFICCSLCLECCSPACPCTPTFIKLSSTYRPQLSCHLWGEAFLIPSPGQVPVPYVLSHSSLWFSFTAYLPNSNSWICLLPSPPRGMVRR